MPRASRYLQAGYTYHLTHRCHDRRFLIKFVRDRDTYRKWLYEAVRRYTVPVYGFCITSNHVHLIVHVDDAERVGLMMHLVAGTFAQQLNRRKKHEGSVWEHPYHCTIIQDGQHLLNCLRYVSLNMVRARVVGHPAQWPWNGHDELTGRRSRYRILALDRLLDSLDMTDIEDLRTAYQQGIEEQLRLRRLRREPEWTESLAVGDRTFVERVTGSFQRRRQFDYAEVTGSADTWTVRDPRLPYGPVSAPELGSKAL